jgi:hypothetical protein
VSSVSETADKPTEPKESSAVEEVLVTASNEAGKELAADTEAVPALSEKIGAEVAATAGVAQASTTTGLKCYEEGRYSMMFTPARRLCIPPKKKLSPFHCFASMYYLASRDACIYISRTATRALKC